MQSVQPFPLQYKSREIAELCKEIPLAVGFDKGREGFNFGKPFVRTLPLQCKKLKTIVMNEELMYVADSTCSAPVECVDCAGQPATLFFEGGLPGMIAITLLLIALLFAAWKAPRWVKEIGLGALVVSAFWTLYGLYQMFSIIQVTGDVPFSVACGGFKVALIGFLYGLIVYFISLIIRVVQKPRI